MRGHTQNMAFGCLLTFSLVAIASCYPTEPSDIGFKILGGDETAIEMFPFQLALEYNGRQICSASVVSKYWALTAAHCVLGKTPTSMQLRAESTRLMKGGILRHVRLFKIHENYNSNNFTYDVAVIRVRKPFVFSTKLLPVMLPHKVPSENDVTWVAGWGYTEKELLHKPDKLLMINIRVHSWEDCKKEYGSQLSETMMCSGSKGKDTCNADSGGPLVRGWNEQVGIVSWGYDCGNGLPGVFTNVSTVTPWILKTTKLDRDSGSFKFPSRWTY